MQLKIGSVKCFAPKEISRPKKFGRKILRPKIFLVRNDFGSKKFQIKNKMVSAKIIFNPKKMGHRKISVKRKFW